MSPMVMELFVDEESRSGSQVVIDGVEQQDVAGGEGAYLAPVKFSGASPPLTTRSRGSAGSVLARARASDDAQAVVALPVHADAQHENALQRRGVAGAVVPGNQGCRETPPPARRRVGERRIF